MVIRAFCNSLNLVFSSASKPSSILRSTSPVEADASFHFPNPPILSRYRDSLLSGGGRCCCLDEDGSSAGGGEAVAVGGDVVGWRLSWCS